MTIARPFRFDRSWHMTGLVMNVPPWKKMFLCAVAVAAGSGCAGAFEAETDPTSTLGPRVQALVEANRAYPKWSDFPNVPEGLPSAVQVAQSVNTLRVTGGALNGEVSRLEWSVQDPAAFERDMAAKAAAAQPDPATLRTQEDIEAFAQRLRDRARPPARITQ